jgi:hypothetical protein
MTRSAPALISLVFLTAGCLGGSPASSAHPTRLTVVVHGINGSKPWHTTWTLRCRPAGGTHPQPRSSCSALSDLLTRHAVPPRHCVHESGAPWTTVRGLYRGRAISLDYAEACASGHRTAMATQALGAYFGHG